MSLRASSREEAVRGEIRVEKPGFATTVQDLGRHGYQRYGIPVGGAIDPFASRLANALVGNEPDRAMLECFAGVIRLRFVRAAVVAVCGRGGTVFVQSPAEVRDQRADAEGADAFPAPMWAAVAVRDGEMLEIRLASDGGPVYVAISGGIETPLQFGSRSTYTRAGIGGLAGRAIAAGDELPVGASLAASLAREGVKIAHGVKEAALRTSGERRSKRVLWRIRRPRQYLPDAVRDPAEENGPDVEAGPDGEGSGSRWTVRVLPGPEWASLNRLCHREYQVANQFDRMGKRLAGAPLDADGDGAVRPELRSEGVVAGAVQIPRADQPIILLAERQTIGGYPVPFIVARADLARAAAAPVGSKMLFVPVSRAEAHAALRAQERFIETVATPAKGAVVTWLRL